MYMLLFLSRLCLLKSHIYFRDNLIFSCKLVAASPCWYAYGCSLLFVYLGVLLYLHSKSKKRFCKSIY